jgi:hypothetical protein
MYDWRSIRGFPAPTHGGFLQNECTMRHRDLGIREYRHTPIDRVRGANASGGVVELIFTLPPWLPNTLASFDRG